MPVTTGYGHWRPPSGHLKNWKCAMGLLSREMFMLFPAGFFAGKVPDIGLCDRVEKGLREMQKNGQGYKAETYLRSFMTHDNMQDLPQFKELTDLIMEESKIILDVHKIKRDSHYITNMWANITSPNRRHGTHAHPNCLLSGLIYIKTPKGCGQTVFFSPRHLNNSIAPEYSEKNDLNSEVFKYPAEKGRMIMWPSYLPHAVDNGNADDAEDRITVAFNVMIRGQIKGLTIALNLT